ncbi:MAG: filamentous hemagglutinin N-terminal domain-containing protein [Verrucomicrobia bacterium]|nr:filamentous hemagglutinin N-terminal domain-containing protein [Verrucomicrobiota bacterium]
MLAHTDNQVAAMRALQSSARAAMVATTFQGLHPEGLQPHSTAQWVGAKAPVSTIDAGGNHHVEIVQESQNAYLYWNKFKVGSKTMLNFNQSKGGADAGKWIAFNKVMGSVSPSEIYGSITAQGQVYILNQNGILFHNGSQVNTRGLVASSLPINPYFAGDPHGGVEGRGILNNTDYQFLFSALKTDKSPSYGETFDPGTISSSQIGGVVVEKGAVISAPTSAANTGGRVMLAGSSVVNRGTISTPDGQTILAAGLQVGVNAHPSTDPSLRGLDVYIGRVVDASGDSVDRDGRMVGTVVNDGMIEVPRGNATLAGRMINQSGVLESSTSVSVNGRFDLMASFNAVVSKETTARHYYYDPTRPEGTTGSILFGPNSLTRILPEWTSTEKLPGSTTALPSLVSALGGSIRMSQGAYIHAPGADVPASLSPLDMTSETRQQPSDSSSVSSRLGSGINLRAGNWAKPSVQDYSLFLLGSIASSPAGSITLDPGSVISAAGSTGTKVPFAGNFLSVQLRGPELANSPLQRSGTVRGETLMLDSRISGTYNGQYWVGTPLGDATGFLNLIERTVGELTAKGGTIALSAGERIALNLGSALDVSGGWINYDGGFASTSKLLYSGNLVDISHATPDRVYDGVYKGGGTVQKYEKWGVTKTFSMSPLDPAQKRYEAGYLNGANGGSILIQAPSMQLAGSLLGDVVTLLELEE